MNIEHRPCDTHRLPSEAHETSHPVFSLAELVTKITVTPNAPDGFLSKLVEHHHDINAVVVVSVF